MADKSKMQTWKLGDEKRVFQEQWTEKYCFVENKGSIICEMKILSQSFNLSHTSHLA
jgi:hypothetical protein